ncbi:GNAT family N-acetyltransferase [Cytobacillus sp. Sa5YUA1]|uniref:GNAT family N-acetyltransferase n=1 Tax=Cytobacillus stercorigallinarum TaxID=2762240 RepID=A0ABR8QNX5_9BACI|nr:GNAT family N-acetyltransferase [Cytobacillus stercorigallinarum]MBD7937220.1 GNAT family N-acetyltransferase [Cytobacillus stercorigallinarum]
MNEKLWEQIEMDTLTSRLHAIGNRPNNPLGVSIQSFGQTMAYTVKNIPGPAFNVIKGFCAEDELLLDKIIDWYDEKHIPARFEIAPSHYSRSLLKALHKRGFYQTDFHTTLYKQLPDTIKPVNHAIEIRTLRQDEFQTFADIYIQGFQMPSFLLEDVAQNNAVLYPLPEWKFYLTLVNHEPAGIGVLFCNEKGANLAAAATLPAFRQKGGQSALIQQRMQHAQEIGCKWIAGQASYGSVSQRNMERAGMRVAYTKAIWVRDEIIKRK